VSPADARSESTPRNTWNCCWVRGDAASSRRRRVGGLGEVGPQSFQLQARQLLDPPGQDQGLVGRATQARHAGVDLQVQPGRDARASGEARQPAQALGLVYAQSKVKGECR